MKSAFRIILALSLPLVACGQSKPDLFLDQTTAALDCAASDDPACSATRVPPHHSGDDADAGAPLRRADECYDDGDCEYGQVCDRRHGVSLCQPEASAEHHGDDDGYGGSGGGGSTPDAGSAGCTGDDDPKGADDCASDGDDHRGSDHEDESYDDGDDDRSGSNSGPH